MTPKSRPMYFPYLYMIHSLFASRDVLDVAKKQAASVKVALSSIHDDNAKVQESSEITSYEDTKDSVTVSQDITEQIKFDHVYTPSTDSIIEAVTKIILHQFPCGKVNDLIAKSSEKTKNFVTGRLKDFLEDLNSVSSAIDAINQAIKSAPGLILVLVKSLTRDRVKDYEINCLGSKVTPDMDSKIEESKMKQVGNTNTSIDAQTDDIIENAFRKIEYESAIRIQKMVEEAYRKYLMEEMMQAASQHIWEHSNGIVKWMIKQIMKSTKDSIIAKISELKNVNLTEKTNIAPEACSNKKHK